MRSGLFALLAGSAVLSTAGVVASAGCGGQTETAGLGEPILVHGARFIEGDLPGAPPVDSNADADAGAPPGPTITSVNTTTLVLVPGQSDHRMTGRATGEASSVALRFADIGTGYWVKPLGPPDDINPGELGWSLTYDVGSNAPYGLHPMRFAAIDEGGNSGPQYELSVCITRPVPDNLNSCLPTIAPPFTVLSLAWDTAMDLDLVVVTPTGKVVDTKHPTTAEATDAGVAPDPKTDGVLDQDANAGCVPSGIPRENLVWQTKPALGTYLVYARVSSACGAAATRFTASLWFSTSTGENDAGKPTSALVESLSVAGEALASQANGGAGLGDYVTAFTIH